MAKTQTNKQVTIRSSAAEYLTFVAATGDNPDSIEMRYEDENVWLTQKIMSELYDISISAINQHLKLYSKMMNWTKIQLLSIS